MWQKNPQTKKKIKHKVLITNICWNKYQIEIGEINSKLFDQKHPIYCFVPTRKIIFKTKIISKKNNSFYTLIPDSIISLQKENEDSLKQTTLISKNYGEKTIDFHKREELRQFPRSKATKEIKFDISKLNKDKPFSLGSFTVKDLAAGGAGLITSSSTEIEVNDFIVISPPKSKLKIRAKVCYIVFHKNNIFKKIGVKFYSITKGPISNPLTSTSFTDNSEVQN